MNKTLMPRYIFEFDTTAEMVAYAFAANDRGADVFDGETGRWHKVVSTGAGTLTTMAVGGDGYGIIDLPLGNFWLGATGAPMIVFVSEDQATLGSQVTDSEAMTIRWNNHATPGTAGISFKWPSDVNPAVIPTIYFDVSKSGATVGDATTLTVTLFNHVVGALHDADANYGGASGALTGNATAKTITRLSRAIAVADLPATFPCATSLTVKPTNALLGTDDLIMHGAFIVYRKK